MLKILLLVSVFNSLIQRIYCFLKENGYQIGVQFSTNDTSMENTVKEFSLYLIKKVRETIWKRIPVIVIHPRTLGDRGTSSLDKIILNCEKTWGVTALQANNEMDAGDTCRTKNINNIYDSLIQNSRQINWDKYKIADITKKINFSDSHHRVKNNILGVRSCPMFIMKENFSMMKMSIMIF